MPCAHLLARQVAADARRSFRALAYKRLHHVPLYLEWAPAAVFAAAPPAAGIRVGPGAAPAANEAGGEEGRRAAAAAATTDAVRDAVAGDDGDAADAGESATIYVKNLAFSTGRAALAAHFDAAVSAAGGRVRAARVSTRRGADGKELSAGFGFVECSSEEVAKAALRQMQVPLRACCPGQGFVGLFLSLLGCEFWEPGCLVPTSMRLCCQCTWMSFNPNRLGCLPVNRKISKAGLAPGRRRCWTATSWC